MYIKNGIAYSSDSTVGIKIRDIVLADNYCICVKFNDGNIYMSTALLFSLPNYKQTITLPLRLRLI